MGRGVKVAVIGGVFTVMVGGAGYGAYNVVSALNGDGGGGTGAAGPAAVRTGPPDEEGDRGDRAKFFAAWASGDAPGAAAATEQRVGCGAAC